MKNNKIWLVSATVFVSLLLVVIIMAAVMRYASTTLLERDAEHTALFWAEFVGGSVRDLDTLLMQGELTDRAHEDLKRFQRVQEVFRFKMFNREGHTVLVSDDLDNPADSQPTKSSIGHGNDNVRNMVLGGNNVILLERNPVNANRPAVYSEAYVPIRRDGQIIGVVEVYVDQADRTARIERAFTLVAGALFILLSAIGLIIGLIILRRIELERLADERMRYLAHHDALSGLLNRMSFNEALHEAVWRHEAGGPVFSVLCIDLDHFKEVNDTLGHGAGDEVLRQVGERLRSLVRHGDRVARLGGDEFAILQTGVAAIDDVSTLAERVVELLARPYDLGTDTIHCNGSVGAAVFGVDGTTEEDLMHKADLALYRSKAAGRGTFSFYDEELDKQLEARRMLTSELRTAIGTEQFTLHYQPQFAPDGTTLKGYEALLRWKHPTLGAQMPDQFIPLAEDTGLIDPLGRWVLRTACAQAALWPDELSVAVNLSAAQFQQGDLVEVVARTLDASGLAAHRLELEITESMLMNNTQLVTQTLARLAAMGVQIAMDDFGTGYSSMAYLWRFPFDKLKIDRSFTAHLASDPKVNLIVKSIISLAHSLDIRVNAEGVENASQLEILRTHKCDEIQGYLLGRPVPDDQLVHLRSTAAVTCDAAALQAMDGSAPA
ncbi:bifunctional diguanylate cyclase/phosphodiesterase [Pseudomonas sp. CC6-YY-74]|uniref:putative bifunctional diguanylate cyclase/phosphodiesterase n=1 Tax=Pseudomonas sp. CC6-YY-74 TaxID=1930532 RepID=UPI0015A7498E|nr:bifunctional diguanylate cyclase/phosphodiesterase [Pseudomonas sp. CC6-YY-74]